jgi:hypothetical protein
VKEENDACHPGQARRRLAARLVCLVTLLPATAAKADNPIVQTIYTADPAPLVYNGRVYLYTGHDEDGSTYFTMNEWRVWSSADMVNWTDHGSPAVRHRDSLVDRDVVRRHLLHRDGIGH